MKEYKCYHASLLLERAEADYINTLLTHQPANETECFSEDETIAHTVVFENGLEMDIKCCGVQFEENEDNRAWAEAVLFKNGSEVACSAPEDTYMGEWELHYNDEVYVVNVEVDDAGEPKTSIWVVSVLTDQSDFTDRYGEMARPSAEIMGVFKTEEEARALQENLINENAHDVIASGHEVEEIDVIVEEFDV